MANDFPASFYKEPHLRPETLAVWARINAFIESSRHGIYSSGFLRRQQKFKKIS